MAVIHEGHLSAWAMKGDTSIEMPNDNYKDKSSVELVPQKSVLVINIVLIG